MLLAWAGVLHWFLHSIGIVSQYASVFHSIAQIQGFLMCFAVGFLFTALPRFTNTRPPSVAQMVIAISAPVGTTIAAWNQQWLISQLFWFALVATLITFVGRRFVGRQTNHKLPASFVWVPLALLMGLAGSVLIGVYQMLGEAHFWVHDVGRLLLLQGMFLGFVLGVGPMVLAMIARHEPIHAEAVATRNAFSQWGHLSAGALLILSFWLEAAWSLRGGLVLRGVIVLMVLLVSAKIWQLPNATGWHRLLAWLSTWMIPIGYLLAALFPNIKKAGLHVVFIGGFASMAFSVGLHVALAHSGHQRLIHGRPWEAGAFGASFLLAMTFRVLMDIDRSHFYFWLGSSAATFLLGTLFWAWLVIPRIWSTEI